MHCRAGPRVATCPSHAPLRSPWPSRPRCQCEPTPSPVTPPPVPANIQVPAGNKAFLVGHAIGTQNYSCLPAGVDAAGHPRFAWTLFTPQATLFAHNLKEVTTHYFSPNPFEVSTNPFADGLIRATWQDSKDTSTVWGKVVPGDSSTDSAFVAPGAIAWLQDHGGGRRRRTHRRPRFDADHLYPAAEHLGRDRTLDGLRARHRMSAIKHSCLTPPTTSSTSKAKGNGDDDH